MECSATFAQEGKPGVFERDASREVVANGATKHVGCFRSIVEDSERASQTSVLESKPTCSQERSSSANAVIHNIGFQNEEAPSWARLMEENIVKLLLDQQGAMKSLLEQQSVALGEVRQAVNTAVDAHLTLGDGKAGKGSSIADKTRTSHLTLPTDGADGISGRTASPTNDKAFLKRKSHQDPRRSLMAPAGEQGPEGGTGGLIVPVHSPHVPREHHLPSVPRGHSAERHSHLALPPACAGGVSERTDSPDGAILLRRKSHKDPYHVRRVVSEEHDCLERPANYLKLSPVSSKEQLTPSACVANPPAGQHASCPQPKAMKVTWTPSACSSSSPPGKARHDPDDSCHDGGYDDDEEVDALGGDDDSLDGLEYFPLKLRKCWIDASKINSSGSLKPGAFSGVVSKKLVQAKTKKFEEAAIARQSISEETRDTGRSRAFVVNPNSTWRLVWDMLSTVLIVFDLITIPLTAFSIEQPREIQMTCCFFWTIDIVLSFNLGYYEQGGLEMRLRQIISRYLRTWFLLDVTIVLADWIVLFYEAPADAKYANSVRGVRALRSLRLLRLVKFKRALEALKDRVVSELNRTLINVLCLVLLIVSLNHLIACTWYGISEYNYLRGEPSWLAQPNFQDAPVRYMYFTSLHWSLTQFTPASMEVTAKNMAERAFSVLVLLFALVVFSSFLSSLTSTMTRFHALRGEQDRQFSELRRFLKNRGVSHPLAVRLQRFIRHTVAQGERRVAMNDCQLLKHLSQPLRLELDMELYSPTLAVHPFLQNYCSVDAGAMRKVCHTCLGHVLISAGDVLFSTAEPCEQMYFLTSGELVYIHEGTMESTKKTAGLEESAVYTIDADGHPRLREGSWCCEAVLWTEWSHQGVMTAMDISQILTLDARQFAALTSSHGAIAPFASIYGRVFVKRVLEKQRTEVDRIKSGHSVHQSVLSDLPFTDRELEELVAVAFPELPSRSARRRSNRKSTWARRRTSGSPRKSMLAVVNSTFNGVRKVLTGSRGRNGQSMLFSDAASPVFVAEDDAEDDCRGSQYEPQRDHMNPGASSISSLAYVKQSP